MLDLRTIGDQVGFQRMLHNFQGLLRQTILDPDTSHDHRIGALGFDGPEHELVDVLETVVARDRLLVVASEQDQVERVGHALDIVCLHLDPLESPTVGLVAGVHVFHHQSFLFPADCPKEGGLQLFP